MKTKKELRNEYKSARSRLGIFQIFNKEENKIYLQSTADLDKAFNADIFKLNAGMHPNKNLQNDWTKFGRELFEFTILDELKSKDAATPGQIRKELKELLEMHKSEMESNGQLLY